MLTKGALYITHTLRCSSQFGSERTIIFFCKFNIYLSLSFSTKMSSRQQLKNVQLIQLVIIQTIQITDNIPSKQSQNHWHNWFLCFFIRLLSFLIYEIWCRENTFFKILEWKILRESISSTDWHKLKLNPPVSTHTLSLSLILFNTYTHSRTYSLSLSLTHVHAVTSYADCVWERNAKFTFFFQTARCSAKHGWNSLPCMTSSRWCWAGDIW